MSEKINSIKGLQKSYSIEVSKSKSGDTYATKALLNDVKTFLERNEPLPTALKPWVIEILTGLLAVKNDELATRLNLRKQGRKSSFNSDEEEMIARSVHGLRNRKGLHKQVNKDGSVGAYEEVAQQFNTTANTVSKIYAKYKGVFELDDSLKVQEEYPNNSQGN